MASNSDKRFIVVTALSEVQVGSHYFQGSDGGIPDKAGLGFES